MRIEIIRTTASPLFEVCNGVFEKRETKAEYYG
jgi:hypothetical protein